MTGVNQYPREQVEKLLLKIESVVHRDGWDEPPFLAVLRWGSPTNLTLTRIPVRIPDPPGAFVHFLGQESRTDLDVAQHLAEVAGERFYGTVFVCEGWGVTEPDAEKLKAIHDSGRSLEEVDGRFEARMVNAVDLHGRRMHIRRIRGQKPTVDREEQAVALGGRVYEALRLITLSIIEQLPTHAEHVDALKFLLVDRAGDVFARHDFRKAAEES